MAECSTASANGGPNETSEEQEQPLHDKRVSLNVVIDVKTKEQEQIIPDSAQKAHVAVVATTDRPPPSKHTSIGSLSGAKSVDILNEVSSKRHLVGARERLSIILFVLLLFAACSLSMVALFGRSEGWISSESNGSLRIGWGKGCLGEKAKEPSTCTSGSQFQGLGKIISDDAGVIGKIAVSLLITAWVLPITVFILVNRIQQNGKETCCHGYTISILWATLGLALIILGSLFILSCQNAADDTKQSKLDVYCKGLRVCTKVAQVSDCTDVTCRITSKGDIHCADHGHCNTEQVELTCEDDGVVCDLVPDWGLYALFVSAALMVVLGFVLGLGSIFIGKEL